MKRCCFDQQKASFKAMYLFPVMFLLSPRFVSPVIDIFISGRRGYYRFCNCEIIPVRCGTRVLRVVGLVRFSAACNSSSAAVALAEELLRFIQYCDTLTVITGHLLKVTDEEAGVN